MRELKGDSLSGMSVGLIGTVAFIAIGLPTFAMGSGAVFLISLITYSFANSMEKHETSHKFHEKMKKEAKHEIKDEEKEKASSKHIADLEIKEYNNEKEEYRDAKIIHADLLDEKNQMSRYRHLHDPNMIKKVISDAQETVNKLNDMRQRLLDDFHTERECYHEDIKNIARQKRDSNHEKEIRSLFGRVESRDDLKEIKRILKKSKLIIDDEFELEKLIEEDERITKKALHRIKDAHIKVEKQIALIKNFGEMSPEDFYKKIDDTIKEIDRDITHVAGLTVKREHITQQIVVELKKIRDDLDSIEQEELKMMKLENQEEKEDEKMERIAA